MSNYIKEIAILALAAIELYALSIGLNGALLSLVVAAIAGLGGYELGKRRNKK